MLFRAHRGGSYYVPENTIAAFKDAIEKKYARIETDPRLTSDGEVILLHDETLNRTCRNEDGSLIEKTMYVSEMTYREILKFDAGIHVGEKFKGERVPRLCDLLKLLDGTDVLLSLDKKTPTDKTEILVNEVKKYNVKTEFSCDDEERIKTVLSLMPEAYINYDGINTIDALKRICTLVPKGKLTVWVYLDKPNFAWLVDRDKASDEVCERVKKYAKLGIANVTCAEDVYEAIKFNPDVIEV